jgi:hypothetical protein
MLLGLLYWALSDRPEPPRVELAPVTAEPPVPAVGRYRAREGKVEKLVAGEWQPMTKVEECEDEAVTVVGWTDFDGLLNPSTLVELDDSTLPTEEGLFLRTLDWWESQVVEETEGGEKLRGLFELTGDELAAMLPDEMDYALGGDVSLRDLIGTPTRDDIARAWTDDGVRDAFEALCRVDIPLLALDVEAMESQQRAKFEEFRGVLRARVHAAQAQLMVELERASGYPHWSFIHRVNTAWMAD